MDTSFWSKLVCKKEQRLAKKLIDLWSTFETSEIVFITSMSPPQNFFYGSKESWITCKQPVRPSIQCDGCFHWNHRTCHTGMLPPIWYLNITSLFLIKSQVCLFVFLWDPFVAFYESGILSWQPRKLCSQTLIHDSQITVFIELKRIKDHMIQ